MFIRSAGIELGVIVFINLVASSLLQRVNPSWLVVVMKMSVSESRFETISRAFFFMKLISCSPLEDSVEVTGESSMTMKHECLTLLQGLPDVMSGSASAIPRRSGIQHRISRRMFRSRSILLRLACQASMMNLIVAQWTGLFRLLNRRWMMIGIRTHAIPTSAIAGVSIVSARCGVTACSTNMS